MLTELLDNHKLVITLEDGILDGGFGEKISRFYGDKNMKAMLDSHHEHIYMERPRLL